MDLSPHSLIIVTVLIYAANGQELPRCAPPEVLLECEPCEKTCADVLNPRHCSQVCTIPTECHCPTGYVRNRPGEQCIPKAICGLVTTENLAPPCPEDEEVPGCEPCEQTCSNIGAECTNVPACKRTGKCFCKTGFLRSANGTCIQRDQCIKNAGKCERCHENCPLTDHLVHVFAQVLRTITNSPVNGQLSRENTTICLNADFGLEEYPVANLDDLLMLKIDQIHAVILCKFLAIFLECDQKGGDCKILADAVSDIENYYNCYYRY